MNMNRKTGNNDGNKDGNKVTKMRHITLTCQSCQHYRPTACVKNRLGYPTARLAECSTACYLPGSDEAETDQPSTIAEDDA